MIRAHRAEIGRGRSEAAGSIAGARCVLIYDGACAYCRRQVERIRALDSQGVLEYVPRDTAGLVERFPQLAAGDFNTGMRLITPDGTVYVGADSLYQVARRLRGWRRLAWLYRVPLLHALARAAYAWIARNRHRLHRDRAAG